MICIPTRSYPFSTSTGQKKEKILLPHAGHICTVLGMNTIIQDFSYRKKTSVRFLLADENRKEELEAAKKKHQENKEAVTKLKENNKEQAKDNKSFNVACYDLQKILVTPYNHANIFVGSHLCVFFVIN